jgi:hypothetical protein
MDAFESPRPFVFVTYFLVAAGLLYLGIGIPLLTPGGYKESLFQAVLPSLIFVCPALLITYRIASMLRRYGSPQSKARSLWLTLPISLGVVILGAVLISFLIFRQHWVELFWNR